MAQIPESRPQQARRRVRAERRHHLPPGLPPPGRLRGGAGPRQGDAQEPEEGEGHHREEPQRRLRQGHEPRAHADDERGGGGAAERGRRGGGHGERLSSGAAGVQTEGADGLAPGHAALCKATVRARVHAGERVGLAHRVAGSRRPRGGLGVDRAQFPDRGAGGRGDAPGHTSQQGQAQHPQALLHPHLGAPRELWTLREPAVLMEMKGLGFRV
mmetsp:Transcript_39362/g.125575  ORF Transcript_39362/g.125575 Transcript_39362/m.125575 type:complete len:214 (+) Transcript_39362:324-965(+)